MSIVSKIDTFVASIYGIELKEDTKKCTAARANNKIK